MTSSIKKEVQSLGMRSGNEAITTGSYSNFYLECLCSVEQVREVKVHDVVPRDDVRVHLLDKIAPCLVCKRA